MQIEYKSNKLKKTLSTPREIMTNYGTMAKQVNKRIEELKAAVTLHDISLIPQANCHHLKGPLKGCLAVDISANYRIVFEPNNNPLPIHEEGGLDWKLVTDIKILSIEDYH